MALLLLNRVTFPRSLTIFCGKTGELKHLWWTLLGRTARELWAGVCRRLSKTTLKCEGRQVWRLKRFSFLSNKIIRTFYRRLPTEHLGQACWERIMPILRFIKTRLFSIYWGIG